MLLNLMFLINKSVKSHVPEKNTARFKSVTLRFKLLSDMNGFEIVLHGLISYWSHACKLAQALRAIFYNNNIYSKMFRQIPRKRAYVKTMLYADFLRI